MAGGETLAAQDGVYDKEHRDRWLGPKACLSHRRATRHAKDLHCCLLGATAARRCGSDSFNKEPQG